MLVGPYLASIIEWIPIREDIERTTSWGLVDINKCEQIAVGWASRSRPTSPTPSLSSHSHAEPLLQRPSHSPAPMNSIAHSLARRSRLALQRIRLRRQCSLTQQHPVGYPPTWTRLSASSSTAIHPSRRTAKKSREMGGEPMCKSAKKAIMQYSIPTVLFSASPSHFMYSSSYTDLWQVGKCWKSHRYRGPIRIDRASHRFISYFDRRK